MTPTPTPTPSDDDFDIHAWLAERHQIGVIWSAEDVRGIRPDLSHCEAWDVLSNVDWNHNADIGITWSVLECHADNMYPLKSVPDDGEE